MALNILDLVEVVRQDDDHYESLNNPAQSKRNHHARSAQETDISSGKCKCHCIRRMCLVSTAET